MVKCFYCGREAQDYQGVMVVDSVTSKIKHFCSGKCRKYSKMGRRKGKWAKNK